MRQWILVMSVLCVWATAAAAQIPSAEKSGGTSQRTGNVRPAVPGTRGKAPIIGQVYIGERAPNFELDGSRGVREKLSKQRGHWVLLVFGERYRDIAGFDSLDAHSHELGADVISVVHEKQQTLTAAAARNHIDMLMLADVTGEVAATYGLFDWGTNRIEPGFFVIDADGIVRLAIVGRLFRPDQMLELLRYETGNTQ